MCRTKPPSTLCAKVYGGYLLCQYCCVGRDYIWDLCNNTYHGAIAQVISRWIALQLFGSIDVVDTALRWYPMDVEVTQSGRYFDRFFKDE